MTSWHKKAEIAAAMARTKKVSPSPASAPSVHERIAAAERALLSGGAERVIVSDADLERIVSLIESTGQTKAQILKKAVRLGLAVLFVGPAAIPEPVTDSVSAYEESFDNATIGGWKKLDPIPYAGFIPTELSEHYTKELPESASIQEALAHAAETI